MAVAAVQVSDVLNLDQVQENASLALYSSCFSQDFDVGQVSKAPAKFLVIGHRGNGMNMLQSSDNRMRSIKENSILSFNTAGLFAVDFIEFDVQVTKDDCPVIFHDNCILYEDKGTIHEKRVTELNLSEFLEYGHQTDTEKVGRNLMRKTKDGKTINWNVETDDSLCTLQEAFQKVESSLGFNIELKFDDYIDYELDHLTNALQSILQVVFDYAKDRPVIFSTFQPDAARFVRKLQTIYPVYFLTEGGAEIYPDIRRNSLEEALNWCLENELQGIVSEVKGVFGNPGVVTKIKESKLSLLTYGKLNNVEEAVYMQHLMGIDGVIVDFVKEITEAVSNLINPVSKEGRDDDNISVSEEQVQVRTKPQFSQSEISFLLKLIPELMKF